jgi:hypothetical protein
MIDMGRKMRVRASVFATSVQLYDLPLTAGHRLAEHTRCANCGAPVDDKSRELRACSYCKVAFR